MKMGGRASQTLAPLGCSQRGPGNSSQMHWVIDLGHRADILPCALSQQVYYRNTYARNSQVNSLLGITTGIHFRGRKHYK